MHFLHWKLWLRYCLHPPSFASVRIPIRNLFLSEQ
nr:MAG TPA_asm: hypothetical protein [Caudoviricetes sp.]